MLLYRDNPSTNGIGNMDSEETPVTCQTKRLIGLCATMVILILIALSGFSENGGGLYPLSRPFLNHVLLAVRGFVGSLASIIATALIGRRLLLFLRVRCEPLLSLVVSAVTGAALLSILATLMTFAHLAYRTTFISMLVIAVFFSKASLPDLKKEILEAFRQVWGNDPGNRYFLLFPFIIWAYAFLCSLIAPYGTDTLAYHLVIPQDILREHGFHFSFFSYQSGMSQGWHMYGLFAFILGGARGFTSLTAWAFGGVLLFISGAIRKRHSTMHAMIAAALGAFLIHLLIGENDRTGIDVPLALIEGVALFCSVGFVSGKTLSRSILVGLCAGFAVASKLTAGAGVALILAILIWKVSPRERIKSLITAGTIALPFALFWPFIAFLNTGSPLPQLLMAMRVQGVPLPQLSETLVHDMIMYRNYHWEQALLSPDTKTAAMLILGGILFLILGGKFREKNIPLLLGIYALLRWIILGATSTLALFHLRYNLVSLLCLGTLASLGWAGVFYRKVFNPKKVVALLILLVALFTWSPMVFYRNSLSHVRDFLSPPGARTSHITCFNWASTNLPGDAVIAGPAIETFYANRKYLQIQGISQEKVDLRKSPKEILSELKRLGVTHLHFSNEYDLPPWSVEMAGKWLISFNKIKFLPDVKLIYQDKNPYWDPLSHQMVREQLYRIEDR